MAFFSWHVVANYALSPVIATSPDSILAQIYQVRCLRFPGDLYHSKHTQGQVYSRVCDSLSLVTCMQASLEVAGTRIATTRCTLIVNQLFCARVWMANVPLNLFMYRFSGD